MSDETQRAALSNSGADASGDVQAEDRQIQNQKDRLDRHPRLLQEESDDAAPTPQPDLEALTELVDDLAEEGGTAFQSVAVAAVQILERALCYEREAANAALSLGQREKLQSMIDTAQDASSLLRETLSANGDKVMHLCVEAKPPAPSDGWWFALTDALEVLEEGAGRMASLTTAQPKGSRARALSQITAQLLRSHHDALLLEAEQWIS